MAEKEVKLQKVTLIKTGKALTFQGKTYSIDDIDCIGGIVLEVSVGAKNMLIDRGLARPFKKGDGIMVETLEGEK